MSVTRVKRFADELLQDYAGFLLQTIRSLPLRSCCVCSAVVIRVGLSGHLEIQRRINISMRFSHAIDDASMGRKERKRGAKVSQTRHEEEEASKSNESRSHFCLGL